MDVAEWMRANRIALPGELAERIVVVKTIGAYRRSMWNATRDFYNDKIDAGVYLDKVIAAIETQMRRAWNEGMRNVGLDPVKDMHPEFEAKIQEIVNSEFNHVLTLAQDIEAARVKIWKQHFGDLKEVKASDPKLTAYNADFQKVLDTEVEYTPHKITEADLNIETNAFSPKVLDLVAWLISDFDSV